MANEQARAMLAAARTLVDLLPAEHRAAIGNYVVAVKGVPVPDDADGKPDLEDSSVTDRDAHIAQWVVDALLGKANNCRKRLAQAERERLIADPQVENMPASVDGLVLSALSQPGYVPAALREDRNGQLRDRNEKRRVAQGGGV